MRTSARCIQPWSGASTWSVNSAAPGHAWLAGSSAITFDMSNHLSPEGVRANTSRERIGSNTLSVMTCRAVSRGRRPGSRVGRFARIPLGLALGATALIALETVAAGGVAAAGGTWTQVHSTVSPPARERAGMATGADGQTVVLFGGEGNA